MESVLEQETALPQEGPVDPNFLLLLQNREQMKMQMNLQKELDEDRRNYESKIERRRVKMDMVKLATDTLMANSRSKPVDARHVTASDITTFADELIQYVNQE